MNSNELTIFGKDPRSINVLRIETEDDAWNLLSNLQNDDFEPPEDILFGDWCNLEICLQGDKWHSSLTPSIFPVFETLQRTIYRSYAEAKYGDKNKRLTKDERERLEIIIRVSEGSSLIDALINFGEVARGAVDKMESKHITIAIVVAVLTYGGTTVHKHYAQNLKEIRQEELSNEDHKAVLEALQFSGEQETKRMKILYAAIKNNDLAQTIYEDSDELHNDMIRSASKAERSIIEGVELEQEVAQELIKSKRKKSEPLQINGLFEVVKLEWHSRTLADITMKHLEDGQRITAAFDLMWFDDEQKEIVRNAEWNEDNPKLIKCNVNAHKTEDGKIVDAQLARIENVTKEDYDDIKGRVESP